MGLDMYLNKHIYVGGNYDHRKVKGNFSFTEYVGTEYETRVKIKPTEVSEIILRVGYWRKANQIHNWFVQNVMDGEDDCREFYVEEEKLKELLELVEALLVTRNPEEAARLLSPASGFFFGGTDIDEYYWEDLEETKKILTACLADKREGSYYYCPSW